MLSIKNTMSNIMLQYLVRSNPISISLPTHNERRYQSKKSVFDLNKLSYDSGFLFMYIGYGLFYYTELVSFVFFRF